MPSLFKNHTLWKIGAIVIITMATINLDLVMKKMWSSGGTGHNVLYTGKSVEEKMIDSDGHNEFHHAGGNAGYKDRFHQLNGHHLRERKTYTGENIRSEGVITFNFHIYS